MKYINADVILPQQLLQEVQKYMQGGMLYIPKSEGQRKRWGRAPAAVPIWRPGTSPFVSIMPAD